MERLNNIAPPKVVRFTRISTQEDYVIDGTQPDVWVSLKNPMKFLREPESEIIKSKKYFIHSIIFDGIQYNVGDVIELKNSEKKTIFSFCADIFYEKTNFLKISGIEWNLLKRYSEKENFDTINHIDILELKEGTDFLVEDSNHNLKECTLLKRSKMNFLCIHIHPDEFPNWYSIDVFNKKYKIVDIL